jgi:predicted deacetylase
MAVKSVPAESVMLVVVHDFSSVFLSELTHITQMLEPLVGRQMSAAIVPRWHGSSGCLSNATYRDLLKNYSGHLLHGWTHQSASRLRPVSLLTGSADEFRGLDETAILKRLEHARADFRELTGDSAVGFLPPAWQLPMHSHRLPALEFVMRFGRLESCLHPERTRPLATSSWDWGRLGWLGYGGEWVGNLLRQTRKGAVPCIAIHPIDVARGFFARALEIIQTLSRLGFRPALPAELMQSRGSPL